MTIFFCAVHDLAGYIINAVIFGIHFMFAQIFYFDRTESAKAGMESYFREANALYLQSFDQLPAEMETGCGGSYRTFVLGIDGLVAFFIFFVWFALDIFWQRRLAQFF